MNKLLLAGACAASIMLGVSSVQAADLYEPVAQTPGWYVSLFGGASFLDDVEITYSNSGTAGLSETETDAGFIVGGAIGMHVNQSMRAEIEVSYFENSVNELEYPYTPASFSASGHVNSVNLLLNVWHDFDLGGGFVPYIGGGAGVGFVNARAFRPNPPDDYNELTGSDVGFAFQVGAGLKFALTDMIAADVGYRYRGIMDVNLPSDDPDQLNASTDIYGHFVQAGVTINMNGM